MAKLKFKDENNKFIPVVQDVKVNGTSVFDGIEANIIISEEYTISVPRISSRITITESDLAYIRNKRPRTLKINFNNGSTINMLLAIATSNSIDYSTVLKSGNYEQFAYFLRISSYDTEQTGCAFSWQTYLVAPEMPMFPQNKTFVFKLINEVPTWVEEQAPVEEETTVENNTLVFSANSPTTIENNILTPSNSSTQTIENNTLILN